MNAPKTYPYTPTGNEDVRMETCILDTEIHYSVAVGGTFVWYWNVEFGRADAHRAASQAFVHIAQQQEKVAHEWAERIREAQKEGK